MLWTRPRERLRENRGKRADMDDSIVEVRSEGVVS